MASERPILPYPVPSPSAALRPWNPTAPTVAGRIIAMVSERLLGTRIEHVGSSAVSGCDGKGYLDFAIPYREEAHLADINEALFSLGFGRQQNREPFPETRPMRIGAYMHDGDWFLLHVHVVPEGGARTGGTAGVPRSVARQSGSGRAIHFGEAGDPRRWVVDGVDYAKAKGRFIAKLGYGGAEDA